MNLDHLQASLYQEPPQCPNPNFRVAPNFGGPDSPGSNFDGDPCEDNASPPRKNWKADEEFYRYDASKDKKKKKKGDSLHGECRPRILQSRISGDSFLMDKAEKACRSQKVQDDINAMQQQLREGNLNPGIGSKPVGQGITELRGKNGGRILIREREGDVVEILGKTGKKKSDQDAVIAYANEMVKQEKKALKKEKQ